MAKVKIEVGKTYNISHTRKGNFRAVITSIDDAWIKCKVIEGGEELTVRLSFCSFSKVN